MRARTLTWVVMITCLTSRGVAYGNSVISDPSNPDSFEYLKTHLDKLIQDNDVQFWNIYRNAEKRAISCITPKLTTTFLALAPIVLGKSDLEEAVAKSLELFLLAKPQCFLDGAVKLDEQSLAVLVNSYLKRPLFTEDKAIIEALKPFKSVAEYQSLMTLYFK